MLIRSDRRHTSLGGWPSRQQVGMGGGNGMVIWWIDGGFGCGCGWVGGWLPRERTHSMRSALGFALTF